MKIYIEVLLIIILMIIFILWRLWFSWTKWRLSKKYKPENDKSRKGGVFDKGATGKEEPGIDRTESGIDTEHISPVGLSEPERREFLPTPVTDAVGEDSIGSRKDSRSIDKLLRRTRKK